MRSRFRPAGDAAGSFARLYYDIGWNSNGNEFRIGLVYDDLSDSIDRKGGLRAGWFHQRDDATGFYVNSKLYENEKNAFVGRSGLFE